MSKCAPHVTEATEKTGSPSAYPALALVTCLFVTKLNDAIYPKRCQKIETLLDATQFIFTYFDLKGTREVPEKKKFYAYVYGIQKLVPHEKPHTVVDFYIFGIQ